jgi:putative ABC transport system permease protein
MAFGLIVGIAGVSVILVRSIHERRHQIGTLRSIGFTENMIVTVFLVESMLLTLLGILIGFGAGVFSSYLFYSFILAEKTGIAYSIPFGEIISIFAVVLLASTIFSYFPARKASKLLPVEATNYLG